MLKIRILLPLASLAAALTDCAGSSGTAHDDGDGHGHDHGHEAVDEVHISRAQTDIAGISFDTPAYTELATALRCTGRLELSPADDASVTPLAPGVVKRVIVKQGQRVAAGQPVAEIESTDAVALQQEYLQALDCLSLAGQELDRQQALASQGAGIARNLQSAVTEREIASAQVEGLRLRLKMIGVNPASVKVGSLVTTMTLTAPITGVVGEINVGTGAYADGTAPLMTILNARGIYCMATVFEKDLPLVAIGEEATVTPVNNPAVTLSGKIAVINPSLDAATKAVQVRVDFSEIPSDVTLLPGMGVTVNLNTGHHRELTLPSDAIFAEGGKSYVFVVEDEIDDELIVHKTPVNTGVAARGLTAILPSADGTMPLDTTTRVAVEGAFYISSMTSDHGEHNH